jgi:quercetin dioxygenase-like cupin family protein
MQPPRRVITGLTTEGRSCLLIDEPAKALIWSTDAEPADNSSMADAGGTSVSFPTTGSRLIYFDMPPGVEAPMHATDTIDSVVIVSGEVVFVTETGETTLRAGDVLVDRGIVHGWRNDGAAPCRMITVLLPSVPIGAGATMSGTMGG